MGAALQKVHKLREILLSQMQHNLNTFFPIFSSNLNHPNQSLLCRPYTTKAEEDILIADRLQLIFSECLLSKYLK